MRAFTVQAWGNMGDWSRWINSIVANYSPVSQWWCWAQWTSISWNVYSPGRWGHSPFPPAQGSVKMKVVWWKNCQECDLLHGGGEERFVGRLLGVIFVLLHQDLDQGLKVSLQPRLVISPGVELSTKLRESFHNVRKWHLLRLSPSSC